LPSQQTEAWVGYDDEAIYICGICYDDSPEDIRSEIGIRDSFTFNSEAFAVHISPFNDGINSMFFCVTLAGVQRDVKFYGDIAKTSWDAVWESAAERTDKGWTVEIRIPYSALRFSNRSVQDWGFNIWRWIARHMEWSCWSYVSNEIDCWWKEMGILQGIKDISPPLRLSFMPYMSTYAMKGTNNEWGNILNGGLDLKYGLSNSFTLDMTLIPDFGQVESDEVELNLTPYEIKYNEKRQFFTEGMELFQKGEIFYSRRIGARPVDHDNVENMISDTEEILKNPGETSLINTTKISGRTNGGLGIGLINGMTARTYATVQDIQTGKKRDILTQAFTNYNIFVLDKSIFENSYLSLTNSNVARKDYLANVTAVEFKLADGDNLYKLRGMGALSYISGRDSQTDGYKFALEAGKTGGPFQYLYSLSVINDTYDQNDLGYLRRNNETVNSFSLSYNMLRPHGAFLNIRNGLSILYGRIYNPSDFSEFSTQYTFSTTFKNQHSMSVQITLAPFEGHDYYETRTPSRYFVRSKYYHGQITLDSDPRQSLSLGIYGSYWKSYDYDFNIHSWLLGMSPTLRINDRLSMIFDSSLGKAIDDLGFLEKNENPEFIVFGRRDRQTLVNTVNISYVFNNKMASNFRLRHYWSMAEYESYYELLDNGRLSPISYKGSHDINYNAFNIDMILRWNFAPGSEILLNWKNSIYTSSDQLITHYWNNLKNTLQSPQVNSISLKIIYYFDYLNIKNLFGKN
ncbi:MAG: DUF5916 domain-containing protein, partial [Candidatus Aminicenantes bacterium]